MEVRPRRKEALVSFSVVMVTNGCSKLDDAHENDDEDEDLNSKTSKHCSQQRKMLPILRHGAVRLTRVRERCIVK